MSEPYAYAAMLLLWLIINGFVGYYMGVFHYPRAYVLFSAIVTGIAFNVCVLTIW